MSKRDRAEAEREQEQALAVEVEEAGRDAEATQRAEEIVDALGQRVGALTSAAGFALLKFAARAREEAEDIWAEAQSIRRNDRS